ncbi:hypothetical protein EXIGLDRAFT_721205 [Exidia glandulosa HHB12029]|uniref:Uncharacterized protein n=1 Tax=Exidia glandulosa HHB12029 TaxID=1314781 RepID=A0A165FUT5_EXIGL|nr:hypothetical protein EXIGLDRAFT_721205 [Exidia glandulosa HHB12029]
MRSTRDWNSNAAALYVERVLPAITFDDGTTSFDKRGGGDDGGNKGGDDGKKDNDNDGKDHDHHNHHHNSSQSMDVDMAMPNQSGTPSQVTRNSNLSIGATAAISVTVSFLGVSAIIWGLWFYCRRRRAHLARTQAILNEPPSPFYIDPRMLTPSPALHVTAPSSTRGGSSVPHFITAQQADMLHAREAAQLDMRAVPVTLARGRDLPFPVTTPDKRSPPAAMREPDRVANPFAHPLDPQEANPFYLAPPPPVAQYAHTSYTLSV